VVENALCIARGLSYLSRSVRTVVDLGEQSIRIFRFSPKGLEPELLVWDYKEFALSDRRCDIDISTAVSDHLDRVGFEPLYALVGGGTANPSLMKAFRDFLAEDLFIPRDPRSVAALGAALIAEDTLTSRRQG